MLQRNKKALSEIVGYVMLILIAVSLAVLVYSFLKVYVPKETPACKEDISIIVQDYDCNLAAGNLNLTLSNKGLFNVSGAYIRVGPENKSVKEQINKNDLYFGGIGLKPGADYNSVYNITNIITLAGDYGLDILPFSYSGNNIVVCDKALISQTISCK